MGLDYKKKHSHGGGDSESFWTSYSDLFLGLSSIFLMLYVVASLRTGTDKCLFYFRKNKQAGLAKCTITNREPANAKGGFGPRKVVFNY